MTQETLLYDVVHDYIISENFASNTEEANKVLLQLSDELIEEIYERTMTASEKRKDTMLKKKYDDSDMKKNMQDQYGKEEGKKVYFATIRKQAMKKEEVEVVNELSKTTLSSYIQKGARDIASKASDASIKGMAGKRKEADKGYEKTAKRVAGVSKAAGKLALKGTIYDKSTNEEVEELDELSKTTTANYLYHAKVDKNYVHSGKMGKYAKARDKGIKRAEKKLGKKVSDRVNYVADYDTRSMRQDSSKSEYPRKIKVKEEVIPEAKVDQGKSDYAKQNERNQRTFGNRRGSRGSLASHDDTEARRYNTEKGRGVKMKGKKDKTPVNYHKRDSDKRVDALLKSMKEAVYTGPNKDDRKLIKKMDDPSYAKKLADYEKNMDPKKRQALKDKATKGMKFTHEEVGLSTSVMMNKAKKEAMLRKKERDAVNKKLKLAKEEVKRDEYGDPVGGPKISKKQKEKNLKANTPDEQHTTTTSEGYGSSRVGPALAMARAVDKVNPRPKPNSKRTRISRALKMASIKKDTSIRRQKENPYSADKKLKMVATSIRDRVKQKAKSLTASEDYIPEEGKTCGVGEYYCYETKKCKKIPSGYHIGARGYLAKDDDENGKKNGKKNGNGNGNGNGGNGNGNGGNGGGMGESVVREAAAPAGQIADKRTEALKKRQSMIKKQVLMKKLQALRSGGGEDVVAHNELEGDLINELNRYGKETGKATGSLNKRPGSPVKSGGSGKTAINMVRNKIRQETGRPAGQRKKVKGVKDTSAAGKFISKFRDKKAYEAKAKKAGFKSVQAYTDTMARYGGEDNYKKGKGLDT